MDNKKRQIVTCAAAGVGGGLLSILSLGVYSAGTVALEMPKSVRVPRVPDANQRRAEAMRMMNAAARGVGTSWNRSVHDFDRRR